MGEIYDDDGSVESPFSYEKPQVLEAEISELIRENNELRGKIRQLEQAIREMRVEE